MNRTITLGRLTLRLLRSRITTWMWPQHCSYQGVERLYAFVAGYAIILDLHRNRP